jgi:NNP family nitrate/nitrite transporter-like MFS transporter
MLVPLAAFAGATPRGVQCWMTSITGGRVHNTLNTVFICFPMILASIFLSLSDCPFIAAWLVVILSGVAGGAFSSCLNSISYFFPRRSQGLALGVVAGIGNLGETLAYSCSPLIVDVGICAGGKDGNCDTSDFGGKYPFNLGVFWTVLCVIVVIPSWLKMNNATGHGAEKGACRSILYYFLLSAYGWFWSLVIGVIWLVSEIGIADNMAVLVIRLVGFSVVAFALVQGSLYYLTPVAVKEKLRPQMAIIKTKDAWVMSSLYTASFGSLMAWCVIFPTVIGAVFASSKVKVADRPEMDDFTWIGPFVGGLSRVLGGYLADKYGGSTITLWSLILLILLTVVEAVLVILAVELDDPTPDFIPFVLVAVFIFLLAGISSGSVFRQIGFLYPPETRGPALGFVTHVASYAAGIIILLIVQGVKNHMKDEDNAHIVAFALVVVLLIPIVVLNWWFYKRASSENQC